jgi:hypothetical protein
VAILAGERRGYLVQERGTPVGLGLVRAAATTLYQDRGFTPTGRTEPLLSDPGLTVLEYVLTPS